MTKICLMDYTRANPLRPGDRFLYDAEHGKEAAVSANLLGHLSQGAVVNLIYDEKLYYNESFLKGFILPTARKIGFDKFKANLRVNGFPLVREAAFNDPKSYNLYSFVNTIIEVMNRDEKRVIREAKKKARQTTPTVWTKPMPMLVPEIGTVLKLSEDWTFRLYHEYRNSDLSTLAVPLTTQCDDQFDEVTIGKGAEISVNRIYIRQGASGYSSITFYLGEGASVTHKGKTTVAAKGKCRFWAKLSDVNKMVVRVDKNTLAEN